MNPQRPSRYAGKPLLRLLECYVLHAIGHLQEKDEASLGAMTPKLREVYHAQGTWREVLEKAMGMPPTLPTAIAVMWKRNQEIAKKSGATLTPQGFAEMFVDANLA